MKLRAFLKNERQKLVNYVRSLISETAELDAEDIVQDVLLRLLERSDNGPALENMTAYVYRSLRNRVVDYRRARKPTISLEQEPTEEGDQKITELLPDRGPGLLEQLQTERGKQTLFEALASLHELERFVIIANEFEGRPFAELSKDLSIPVNTLLSHKSRAKKKLKQIYRNLKETEHGQFRHLERS